MMDAVAYLKKKEEMCRIYRAVGCEGCPWREIVQGFGSECAANGLWRDEDLVAAVEKWKPPEKAPRLRYLVYRDDVERILKEVADCEDFNWSHRAVADYVRMAVGILPTKIEVEVEK